METGIKQIFIRHIYALQDTICSALEQADGKAVFKEDAWKRPGGGGGLTRIIENGRYLKREVLIQVQ